MSHLRQSEFRLYLSVSSSVILNVHPSRLKWVFTAYDELMQSWCLAEDLESFEHVGMESVSFVVGPVSLLTGCTKSFADRWFRIVMWICKMT